MNLHNISTNQKKWGWIQITGGQGRYIGTHAYELTRVPAPPIAILTTPFSARWQWSPYARATRTLFDNGYIRPLCGHQSRTQYPTARQSTYSGCRNCTTAANGRGIMIFTSDMLLRDDTEFQAIIRERNEWNENERRNR